MLRKRKHLVRTSTLGARLTATLERARLVEQLERAELLRSRLGEAWIDEAAPWHLPVDDAFLLIKGLHARHTVETDAAVRAAGLPIHPIEQIAIVDDVVGDHHVDELTAIGTAVIGLT